MKVVCMCQAGNNRSAGLACQLKDGLRNEAIAIGWQTAGEELKKLLFAWAERIVVMETSFRQFVPIEHQDKVMVCDVGLDRYGNPYHPDLQAQVKRFIVQCFG